MSDLPRGGCVGDVDLGARVLVGGSRPIEQQSTRSPHQANGHYEASEDPEFIHGVRSSFTMQVTRGSSVQRQECVKGERGPAGYFDGFRSPERREEAGRRWANSAAGTRKPGRRLGSCESSVPGCAGSTGGRNGKALMRVSPQSPSACKSDPSLMESQPASAKRRSRNVARLRSW
jgi:hypothetical protein